MNEKSQAGFSRIIWAVDALQESSDVEPRGLEAIQTLVGSSPTEVEPVSVLPPYRIQSPFELLYPPFPYSSDEVVEALVNRLKYISSPKLCPLKILDKPVMSTAGAVLELSKYAEERKADLIVVGTHCRKGLSRLFLGSFAESLLLQSRVPLFMIGTHTAQITRFKSIFFPTDFRRTSGLVFPRVVELAKSLDAKLYIYHRVPKPIFLPTGLVPTVDFPRLLKEEKINTRTRLDKYLELARRSDLKAEIVYELSDLTESEAILTAARAKNASIIAMAAQSGIVRSTIAGSTTRQVVRGAFCPVWVLHARGFTDMADLVHHGQEQKLA